MSLLSNSISQKKSNHSELEIRGWLVFGSRASFAENEALCFVLF